MDEKLFLKVFKTNPPNLKILNLAKIQKFSQKLIFEHFDINAMKIDSGVETW